MFPSVMVFKCFGIRPVSHSDNIFFGYSRGKSQRGSNRTNIDARFGSRFVQESGKPSLNCICFKNLRRRNRIDKQRSRRTLRATFTISKKSLDWTKNRHLSVSAHLKCFDYSMTATFFFRAMDLERQRSKIRRYSCWNNCSDVLQFYTFCFVSLQSDTIELLTIPHQKATVVTYNI